MPLFRFRHHGANPVPQPYGLTANDAEDAFFQKDIFLLNNGREKYAVGSMEEFRQNVWHKVPDPPVLKKYRFTFGCDNAGDIETSLPHEIEAADDTDAFAQMTSYLKRIGAEYVANSMQVSKDGAWEPVPVTWTCFQPSGELKTTPPLGGGYL